jgi:2-polyprenyl-3-methyl-5-hydroxy-6-metoxy-1,4-benzoquinol methylase
LKPCDLCGGVSAAIVLELPRGVYLRCPECGFVFSRGGGDEAEQFNRDFFARALQRYVDTNYSPRQQRIYARDLRGLRPFFGSGRLLEVGCNVGGFLHCARGMGWEVAGVEPVDTCAQYAREQGMHVVTGTLEEADMPEASFDVVYSNAVLEHIPSPRSAFAAIARVLRPGGVVFTRTVNFDCYTREQIGSAWRLLAPNGHVSMFNAQTLSRFNEQAGLETLRVQSNGVRVRRGPLAFFRKGILSTLARFTHKGDRIIVWGRKPQS